MSESEIMFCCDAITVYYPTAPGRVYAVPFRALADSEVLPISAGAGYWATLTRCSDLATMLRSAGSLGPLDLDSPSAAARRAWIAAGGDFDDSDYLEHAVEEWAEWCDRDSASRDSAEEAGAAIVRAA